MTLPTFALWVLAVTLLVTLGVWMINRMLDARSADARRRNHAREPLVTRTDLVVIAVGVVALVIVAWSQRP